MKKIEATKGELCYSEGPLYTGPRGLKFDKLGLDQIIFTSYGTFKVLDLNLLQDVKTDAY